MKHVRSSSCKSLAMSFLAQRCGEIKKSFNDCHSMVCCERPDTLKYRVLPSNDSAHITGLDATGRGALKVYLKWVCYVNSCKHKVPLPLVDVGTWACCDMCAHARVSYERESCQRSVFAAG